VEEALFSAHRDLEGRPWWFRGRPRWAFDVELLQRLQQAWGHSGCGTIVDVPLNEWHDVGESKVSLGAGVRAFAFLVRLGLRLSPRPEAMSPRVREQVADRVASGDDR
jgi:hypothetical protein